MRTFLIKNKILFNYLMYNLYLYKKIYRACAYKLLRCLYTRDNEYISKIFVIIVWFWLTIMFYTLQINFVAASSQRSCMNPFFNSSFKTIVTAVFNSLTAPFTAIVTVALPEAKKNCSFFLQIMRVKKTKYINLFSGTCWIFCFILFLLFFLMEDNLVWINILKNNIYARLIFCAVFCLISFYHTVEYNCRTFPPRTIWFFMIPEPHS